MQVFCFTDTASLISGKNNLKHTDPLHIESILDWLSVPPYSVCVLWYMLIRLNDGVKTSYVCTNTLFKLYQQGTMTLKLSLVVTNKKLITQTMD